MDQVQIVGAPSLTADEVYLIAAAIGGQPQPQYNMYFSRVRFTSTVSTTPFQYTIASGQKVVAFGYGVGQSAVAGGLPLNATASDTSVQQAGQTINAEFCLIRGVALFIASGSELTLAKQLDPSVNVQLILGSTAYQLGIPTMSPGGAASRERPRATSSTRTYTSSFPRGSAASRTASRWPATRRASRARSCGCRPARARPPT